MTVRDIRSYLTEICGVDVSPDLETIPSRILTVKASM
jgi:hypothetical protein